jgi:hypothetical protein
MFSNFKTLLVAGVALPALVGVAFAQGAATTNNSVSPNAPAAAIGAAPAVKSDSTISTPAVKGEAKVAPAAKADVNVGSSTKPDNKVEPSAKAGTTTSAPAAVDSSKPAPAKSSAATPDTSKKDDSKPEAKKEIGKTSMVKQHHLKTQDVQKTGATDKTSASKIARSPAKLPKAGDVATPGTAAQKL